jgi:hypothetical protein
MFHATVMNRIGHHVNRANIVTLDNGSCVEGNMELLKQPVQPATLSHNMCNFPALSLSTGGRDSRLAFRGPRHQIIIEIHAVARGITPRVWTTSLVYIRICCEGVHTIGTNVKT